MKSALFAFVSMLVIAPFVSAAEPAINCLQWQLRTEREFVSKRNASVFAKSIVDDLSDYGVTIESVSTTRTERAYFFRYDRDSILNDVQRLASFEEAIFQLSRTANSRLGFQFQCSFLAPEPLPRISGSSLN